ncbi:MAG TPA: helix-turn-helix domain-containing protein [Candidatus Bathyarchaeia archaeon]|nr:helix-turn-helix domain-containing protein [Candidatus Bathyarchaeia archaeon]
MPVPGSLKRRPIDEKSIAETLSSQFKVPNEEVVAYLKLLDTSDLTLQQLSEKLAIDEDRASTLVSSMLSRGLIIEASGTPKRFAPLHPRMMLTNLFKILEKELVQTLRDRRATVDRVVNLLIPVYEERETLVVASRKT